MSEWKALANEFSAASASTPEAKENLAALARICEFIALTHYGRELKPTALDRAGTGSLILTKRDRSCPTKSFRIMSLADRKIEFCLRDHAAQVEHYFHPDEPHDHALSRFQKVVRSIDWHAPVTRPSLGENLCAVVKSIFVKRYR